MNPLNKFLEQFLKNFQDKSLGELLKIVVEGFLNETEGETTDGAIEKISERSRE